MTALPSTDGFARDDTLTLPDMTAVCASVAAQGFCLLPALFPNEVVERLRFELDAARSREEESFGLHALKTQGQEGYVSDILNVGPTMRGVLGSSAVANLADGLLGNEARLCIAQGIILDPGTGRGTWPRRWHADFYDPVPVLREPTFHVAINCLLAVDDMTVENGATGVLPGSHRLTVRPETLGSRLEELELRLEASAGSIVVLEGGVWHCAGFNASSMPRRVVKMLFARSWVRQKIHYADLLTDAMRSTAPLHLERLLGAA